MSYGFNSVDDISRAICHSGGMKDKYGTPMCDVNAKLIYDYIKSLEETLQKIHDVANPPTFNHQKPKQVKDHVNDVLPKVEHLRQCFSKCAHECRDHELNSISRSIVETDRKDWIEKEKKYRKEIDDLKLKLSRSGLESERKIFAEREVIFRAEIKKLQQQIGVVQRMNKRLRK